MKVKWSKTWPKKMGWYWCKFPRLAPVPCRITKIGSICTADPARGPTCFHSARHRRHDIRFGPAIEMPDETIRFFEGWDRLEKETG